MSGGIGIELIKCVTQNSQYSCFMSALSSAQMKPTPVLWPTRWWETLDPGHLNTAANPFMAVIFFDASGLFREDKTSSRNALRNRKELRVFIF